jgi:hypothetical protein
MSKRFFIKKHNEEPEKINTPINWKRIVRNTLVAVVSILIIVYVGFQLKNFCTRVSGAWNEIKFAYEKPSLVRAIRQTYETKQQALDAEMMKVSSMATQSAVETEKTQSPTVSRLK